MKKNMGTPPEQTVDVQKLIDDAAFSPYQWIIFSLCFLVILADGFDTGVMGFIAPSLVVDWKIDRSLLGPVMSAALVGMAIGALVAGPLADKLGRKTVVLLSTAFSSSTPLRG